MYSWGIYRVRKKPTIHLFMGDTGGEKLLVALPEYPLNRNGS